VSGSLTKEEVLSSQLKNVESLTDALSVDVEDYFHVEAFADRIQFNQWATFSSRVRRNCDRILDMFERHGWRATFFVLGWVAERDRALIQDIANAGHELGCHSYAHRRVFSLRPEEFREDLRRARGLIEDAAGVHVLGYRAPTFSIVHRSLWALEILADEGFLYDSSIFPIRHDVYGYPEFPRFLQRVQLASGRELFEVPMSTIRLGGLNWPLGGGGYLRLLPLSYSRWAIRRIHRQDRQSVILYFHPWEIDPDQPRLEGSWKSKLRHYTGLRKMETRLEELLSRGRYEPLKSLVTRLRDSAPVLQDLAHRA
jgi:polysaccharide deacetylase family protein (PEP-CTERM system associated)